MLEHQPITYVFLLILATLTEAEKKVGLDIVDKLDSIINRWTGSIAEAGGITGLVGSSAGTHVGSSAGTSGGIVAGTGTGGALGPVYSSHSSSHHIGPSYIDCIIIIDNSGSIGEAEFKQAKEAMKVTNLGF